MSQRGLSGIQRTERGADPEAPVDHQVGVAAVTRGDQLLDRRVDRGVLATDAGSRQQAEQREHREVGGQRRGRRRGEVQAEGQREELLAAELVSEPAEEQGARHGANQVETSGEADLHVAQVQHRARLERTGDRARDRYLKAIEHPGNA
jgi:hypothetical protein